VASRSPPEAAAILDADSDLFGPIVEAVDAVKICSATNVGAVNWFTVFLSVRCGSSLEVQLADKGALAASRPNAKQVQHNHNARFMR
jgi:hypothetical protein